MSHFSQAKTKNRVFKSQATVVVKECPRCGGLIIRTPIKKGSIRRKYHTCYIPGPPFIEKNINNL